MVVLVLCAPGEQHLAELAGWSETLSWGFAGLLSLYAGISAVVATVRPRGARGKSTAVAGAILSLLLAMAAQPVSHLFVTGWLTAEPRPPWLLVVTVSTVPPFILGHLLHLAASPVRPVRTVLDKTAGQSRTVPVPSGATEEKARRTAVAVVRPGPGPSRTVPVPSGATEEKARRTAVAVVRPGPGQSRTAGQAVSLVHPDRTLLSVPQADTSAGQAVPSLKDKQNMSARALELVRLGQDDETIKDTLRTEFAGPDGQPPKPDSVRKSVKRARDTLSRAS